MHRRQVLFSVAGGVALTAGGASQAAANDLAAQVRDLADRYAAAWNAADMDAMTALYADDVHWVNIVGMHWQGKRDVDHAHRVYFDIMFKGVPMTLQEIESVVPLPGGGAVAVIRWAVGAFTTPVGQPVPPSRDRMSLVLTPDGDRLRIAHGANVQVDEMAQRSNPVTARRER
jgi:uncharacterized protein (TIGR02246 family)